MSVAAGPTTTWPTASVVVARTRRAGRSSTRARTSAADGQRRRAASVRCPTSRAERRGRSDAAGPRARVDRRDEASDTSAADRVTRTNPPSEASASEGQRRRRVVVSSGPAPVNVPDVARHGPGRGDADPRQRRPHAQKQQQGEQLRARGHRDRHRPGARQPRSPSGSTVTIVRLDRPRAGEGPERRSARPRARRRPRSRVRASTCGGAGALVGAERRQGHQPVAERRLRRSTAARRSRSTSAPGPTGRRPPST